MPYKHPKLVDWQQEQIPTDLNLLMQLVGGNPNFPNEKNKLESPALANGKALPWTDSKGWSYST